MNVANRISEIAEANEIEFLERGNDENDARALADAAGVAGDYEGHTDNLLDVIEAEIAAL